ncbi:MAG: PAS domain-containing protein, partial [Candidatus Bathyarchaeia archaeon]
ATYEAFLNSVHPDDREHVKKSVDQALHEDKPYSIDHRIVLPGEVRVVHEQAEVTFNDSGKPIRMIGTVQDITDRKRMEEELRNHIEHLADIVEKMTRMLSERGSNKVRKPPSPCSKAQERRAGTLGP